MFGDKLKFLKSKSESEDGKTDKKKIENLVIFIVILVITIIAVNTIISDDKKDNAKDNSNDNSKQLAKVEIKEDEDDFQNTDLEDKLKKILQKIQGVGDVEVFINYSESSETIAMFNENSKSSLTEETDTSGGKRTIEETDTQKDIIYKEDGGEKIPITQKVVQPKIEGAIIAAQGAGNATVKANIVQAVEAATGLATHKIQVFEMEV